MLSHYFSGIRMVAADLKKPFPDGILNILALTHIEPEALLVIDDRLLTGVLAAVIANVPACYVVSPIVCLACRPVQELFFMLLRRLERAIV